ncbi:MAG TPA: hypothetical protein VKE91_04775 [Blastocatellia bacterium]|nr:hypothetical protein [Blastocatellia bacterium]
MDNDDSFRNQPSFNQGGVTGAPATLYFFESRKNEFRNNNFGGALGGPVIKNRTFFFGAYEGQREFVFSPSVVRVPSAADIAAANTVAQSSIRSTTRWRAGS